MTQSLNEIETPAFVVNEERVLKNIAKFQAHCDSRGLRLRPQGLAVRLAGRGIAELGSCARTSR